VVGDTVSLTREPCPHCGRTGERVVGPVVRGGDLVKVKGMLVNPGALVAALAAMHGLDEFQVVVRREHEADPYSMDELAVRIACSPACTPEARESLVKKVAALASEVLKRRTPSTRFSERTRAWASSFSTDRSELQRMRV